MKQININGFFEENCKKGTRRAAGSASVYMGIYSGRMRQIRLINFSVRSHVDICAMRLLLEVSNEAS